MSLLHHFFISMGINVSIAAIMALCYVIYNVIKESLEDKF